MDRERLRITFNAVASLYDAIRPTYPAEMIADLAREASLGRGTRVLEIGCGTGQLTQPLAERGAHVLAVELGPDMAAIARRNLADFPEVHIVVDAFENWPLPDETFDLVVSATAFHWLDPAVRVAKAVEALRPGGVIAVIDTHHIAGGDVAFFEEAQECYLRFDPGARPGFRLPTAEETPSWQEELDAHPLLHANRPFRYEWERSYAAHEYCDLLRTYSDTRKLGDAREALVACIGDLIDRRHHGRITKRYLTLLQTARRAE